MYLLCDSERDTNSRLGLHSSYLIDSFHAWTRWPSAVRFSQALMCVARQLRHPSVRVCVRFKLSLTHGCVCAMAVLSIHYTYTLILGTDTWCHWNFIVTFGFCASSLSTLFFSCLLFHYCKLRSQSSGSYQVHIFPWDSHWRKIWIWPEPNYDCECGPRLHPLLFFACAWKFVRLVNDWVKGSSLSLCIIRISAFCIFFLCSLKRVILRLVIFLWLVLVICARN